jgi:hypothetical protein
MPGSILLDWTRGWSGNAPSTAEKQASGKAMEPHKALALARMQTDTEPTEGQKINGNYRKGRARVQGLSIVLENPKGSKRSGKDANGKAWENSMVHDYGYFAGTEGADGDCIDVFIGPDPTSKKVWVIDQMNKDGTFDEVKALIGFHTKKEAVAGYLDHYPKGWRVGKVTSCSIAELKRWMFSDQSDKPFRESINLVKTAAEDRCPHGVLTPFNSCDECSREKRAGFDSWTYPAPKDPLGDAPADTWLAPGIFSDGLAPKADQETLVREWFERMMARIEKEKLQAVGTTPYFTTELDPGIVARGKKGDYLFSPYHKEGLPLSHYTREDLGRPEEMMRPAELGSALQWIQELQEEDDRISGGLGKEARNGFRMPENYGEAEEVANHGKHVKFFTGQNDWEEAVTWVWAELELYGDVKRYWFEVAYPPGEHPGDDDVPKEVHVANKKRGEGLVKKWIAEAKAEAGEDEFGSKFIDALPKVLAGALKDDVESHGRQMREWVEKTAAAVPAMPGLKPAGTSTPGSRQTSTNAWLSNYGKLQDTPMFSGKSVPFVYNGGDNRGMRPAMYGRMGLPAAPTPAAAGASVNQFVTDANPKMNAGTVIQHDPAGPNAQVGSNVMSYGPPPANSEMVNIARGQTNFPGAILAHEGEHLQQSAPSFIASGTLPPEQPDPAASKRFYGASETPAVFAEASHALKSHADAGGAPINVPLTPDQQQNGGGVPSNLWNQQSDRYYMNQGKSMTELLGTPEARQFLQKWQQPTAAPQEKQSSHPEPMKTAAAKSPSVLSEIDRYFDAFMGRKKNPLPAPRQTAAAPAPAPAPSVPTSPSRAQMIEQFASKYQRAGAPSRSTAVGGSPAPVPPPGPLLKGAGAIPAMPTLHPTNQRPQGFGAWGSPQMPTSATPSPATQPWLQRTGGLRGAVQGTGDFVGKGTGLIAPYVTPVAPLALGAQAANLAGSGWMNRKYLWTGDPADKMQYRYDNVGITSQDVRDTYGTDNAFGKFMNLPGNPLAGAVAGVGDAVNAGMKGWDKLVGNDIEKAANFKLSPRPDGDGWFQMKNDAGQPINTANTWQAGGGLRGMLGGAMSWANPERAGGWLGDMAGLPTAAGMGIGSQAQRLWNNRGYIWSGNPAQRWTPPAPQQPVTGDWEQDYLDGWYSRWGTNPVSRFAAGLTAPVASRFMEWNAR